MLPKTESGNFISLILMIGMIAINILIVYLFDSILSKFELESAKQSLQRHVEHQSKNYENAAVHLAKIEALQHDIDKHMTYIHTAATSNRNEDVTAYINNLRGQKESSYIKVKSFNSAVDAIVNNAISVAEGSDIKIISNIDYIGNDIGVDNTDLVQILGNIPDNAIDACKKVKDMTAHLIGLNISIQDNCMMTISAKNPCSATPVKNEKGLFHTTKNNDVIKHGIGLQIIEDKISKYPGGDIKFRISEGIFEIICFIPFAKQNGEIMKTPT